MNRRVRAKRAIIGRAMAVGLCVTALLVLLTRPQRASVVQVIPLDGPQPEQRVDRALAAEVTESLDGWLGCRYQLAESQPLPVDTLLPMRGQWDAKAILRQMKRNDPAEGERRLYLANVDGTRQDLNFVFGLAHLGGRHAVVFLPRLLTDPDVTPRRLLATTRHETGHLFGLRHCDGTLPDGQHCVLALSYSAFDIDDKSLDLCPRCAARVPRSPAAP